MSSRLTRSKDSSRRRGQWVTGTLFALGTAAVAAGVLIFMQTARPVGYWTILLYTVAVVCLLATIAAVALIPMRARNALRSALFSLLSDPRLSSRALPDAYEISRRVSDLVRAYHQPMLDKEEASLAASQIETELLQRLKRPLREDYLLEYELELRPPEAGVSSVSLRRQLSFRVHNYHGQDGYIFGLPTFFMTTIDKHDDLEPLNLKPSERVSLTKLVVDGSELVSGTDYAVEYTVEENSIRMVAQCDKRFRPDQSSCSASYVMRSVVPAWDYSTFSVISVVRSLVLRVAYNPDVLQVKALAMVPSDWDVARMGRQTGKGLLEIDLSGKILIPGQTLLVTWRPMGQEKHRPAQ
jgi:hypothetical protein